MSNSSVTVALPDPSLTLRGRITSAVPFGTDLCTVGVPISAGCTPASLWIATFPDQCLQGMYFSPAGIDNNGCALVPYIPTRFPTPDGNITCSPQPVSDACSSSSKYLATFPDACVAGYAFTPFGRDLQGCPNLPFYATQFEYQPYPSFSVDLSLTPYCRNGVPPSNCTSNASSYMSQFPVCSDSQYFNYDGTDGCSSTPVSALECCSSLDLPEYCSSASVFLGQNPICNGSTFAPFGWDVFGCPVVNFIQQPRTSMAMPACLARATHRSGTSDSFFGLGHNFSNAISYVFKCVPAPTNASLCSDASMYLSQASVGCQPDQPMFAPFGVNEYGCPWDTQFGPFSPPLNETSLCNHVLPVNASKCSALSQYLMAMGPMFFCSEGQSYLMWNMVDEKGCALAAPFSGISGLLLLNSSIAWQPTSDISVAIADISLDVPVGSDFLVLHVDGTYYF